MTLGQRLDLLIKLRAASSHLVHMAGSRAHAYFGNQGIGCPDPAVDTCGRMSRLLPSRLFSRSM